MADDRTPTITRTPFDPLPPPVVRNLWFCPACGQEVRGSYNIDAARKRCTKTWHLTTAKPHRYIIAPVSGDGEGNE